MSNDEQVILLTVFLPSVLPSPTKLIRLERKLKPERCNKFFRLINSSGSFVESFALMEKKLGKSLNASGHFFLLSVDSTTHQIFKKIWVCRCLAAFAAANFVSPRNKVGILEKIFSHSEIHRTVNVIVNL